MNLKTTDVIKSMPKAILHLHLDGSLRPETVHKWLQERGEDVTLEEVKKRLMVDEGCRDLNQYLEKFDLPVELLQSGEHIEQATYELFEDLAKQNVIYAEVRFAPSLHTKKGLSYKQIVEAAIKGMERAKQEKSIEGNLILCCMRGDNNQQENIETMVAAKKYQGQGVVAVDLAGAEAIFPTENFKDIFSIAKKQNIPFIIHAGEAARTRKYKSSN